MIRITRTTLAAAAVALAALAVPATPASAQHHPDGPAPSAQTETESPDGRCFMGGLWDTEVEGPEPVCRLGA